MVTNDALGRKLEVAIRCGTGSWLPGFAAPLAQIRWEELWRSCGIDSDVYGTARVRSSDPSEERDIRAEIRMPAPLGRNGTLSIETMRKGIADRYLELGLDLAPPHVAGSSEVSSSILRALHMLGSVPDIAGSLGPVLWIMHVAVPEGPDYDVSYSDPDVPFSIFVGVTKATGPVADLRLAESILHECMHLQLTLVENVLPLVADAGVTHPSPWQRRMRPAGGVLHGIYVFAVIRDFMASVRDDPKRDERTRRHAAERVRTTSDEIAAASAAVLSGDGLSSWGRRLVQRCLA